MKRTSSFLRFTDFLLVAFSAKFKGKNLCKISKWELSRWPKVTKHRYATTILYFLTNIKLETRKFNISEGEWSLSWFEKSVNFKFGRSIEVMISFVSIGYETMSVIRARACAKP